MILSRCLRTVCYGLVWFLILLSVDSAIAEIWQQTNGPAGGNIEAVALDPGDSSIVYAGGRSGTLFKSINGGQTWSALVTIDLSAIIHQIHVLTGDGDPLSMYISTGALYKSIDGGQSITEVANVGGVNDFAVSPDNDQIVAVASPDGMLYYTDDGFATVRALAGAWNGAGVKTVTIGGNNIMWAGTATGGEGKLYKSTDNGISWTEVVLSPRNTSTDINSIFIDPELATTMYVGLADVNNEVFDAANDSYLLKTTDGGDSWSALHLTNTDSSINILGQETGGLLVASGSIIVKSTDGGGQWTDISPPARQADGARYIALDGQTIYAPAPIGTGVLKSSDFGLSWSVLTNGITNVSISLLAVPRNQASGTLFATSVNGEGTFRSTNNGGFWENLVFNGITHRWADELQVNPHNDNEVWQVADVGEIFKTDDSGNSWEKILNPYGDGFRYGSIYAMASAPSDKGQLYALRSGFGIYKSIDVGDSWSFLHNSEIDYSYTIAVHPDDADTVYSGFLPKPFQDSAMVRKSVDGGDNWETTLQVPGSTGITSVTIDPSTPSTVYAGSSGDVGTIWKSVDRGSNWQQPNEYFTFTNVHTLTADPTNANSAYAGIWGGGSWKTIDGGQSWAALANDPTISAVAILVHPTDSNIIYIADRTAPRIYKTTNGGISWETWFDAGPGYYRILSAELSPVDPDVVYASVFLRGGPMLGDLFAIDSGVASNITGNLPRLPVAVTADPQNSTVLYAVTHMQGLYKTVNSGQTWSDLTANGAALPLEVGFSDLVIDPTNSDTLYLLGGNDVDETLSHRGAEPFAMNTVYKSTDGGNSWQNLNDGSFGNNSGAVKGLSISPLDSSVLFVATLKGIFSSTDSGSSWRNENNGLNYCHMAGVASAADAGKIFCPTLGGGVFVGTVTSADHTVSWDAASTLKAEVHHVMVRVDPNNSDTVYASAYPGGIFKSNDGGLKWQESNFGMASFKIDDPRRQGYYAFALAQSDPQTVYLGLYGVGLYKSTDGAATWMPKNGDARSMRGKTITDLLINPADENNVIVATESGIYRTIDGGSSWSSLNNGLDTLDIRTLAWGDNGQIYAGTRGYEVYLFEDNTTWRQLNGFGQYGTFWPIWDGRPLYQYTSLLFHPTDADTLYIGTFPAGIFKSVDRGVTWQEKNVGWLNDGVFSLVFKPGDPTVLYAGTYNGLSLSVDAGEHWQKYSDGWPPEQWVFSIDFDPRNPDIIYACSKNGENEGRGRDDFHGTVMKTIDGGVSWTTINNGLQLDNEFYKIVVDRHFPDTLYLASQHDGVFVSKDAGGHWDPFNKGLTNTAPGTNGNNVTNTMLLSVDGNYLYFGSNGSGVFTRLLHDDTDTDGLADAWEQEYFGDLNTTNGGTDGGTDSDDDGLLDSQEYIALSSPLLEDTDSDGLPDAYEVQYRLNLLVDDSGTDVDNDGYTNIQEFISETSPVDPSSKPLPATAVSLEASNVTWSSATLNGTVNPNGLATQYYFQYGLSDSYGYSTTVTVAGDGTTATSVTANITSLQPDTVYHYRIVADTGMDMSYGVDMTLAFVVAEGDVNLSGTVDLRDIAAGMDMLTGKVSGQSVHHDADVNNDGRIGLEEPIHSLQKEAAIRE